jgi:lipopolysaccharide biosynthesis regulator YciM
MLSSLLLLLLPIAAASGWYAAKRSASPFKENTSVTQHYLAGIHYLLNEQPDKAVDTFIKMLEVDDETVETHLALGTLFRRRGEVDRAIRIHQNLIARPQLPRAQRLQALLALGEDYLKAGVLDRAERLFLEIIENDAEYKLVALTHLLSIYQQEKRWELAISVASKLLSYDSNLRASIAHYYCELAQMAQANQQAEQVSRYLKQAVESDPGCARATLMYGDVEYNAGRYQNALDYYQAIKIQAPEYLPEVLPRLILSFEKLNQQTELTHYLQSVLSEYSHSSLVLIIAKRIQQHYGVQTALDFVANYLQKKPSLQGLQYLISLYLLSPDHVFKNNLLLLQEVTTQLLQTKPQYQCMHCGFISKVLHWLCPGCKQWSTIKCVEVSE